MEADATVNALLSDVEELGYGVVPGVLDTEELSTLRKALDRASREDDAAETASRYGPNNCKDDNRNDN